MNRTRRNRQKSVDDSRRAELDWLRLFAISCVVLCHAVEAVYLSNEGAVLTTLNAKIAFSALHTVGRLGVPIFLMLTGALVLPKCFEKEADFHRFWLHNLLPLLVTIEIWVVIYNIYLLMTGGTFQKGDFIRELILVQDVPLDHWWYLPMVARLYLVVPFISIALRHARPKWYAPIFLVLFIYIYLFGTYERLRVGAGLPGSAAIPVFDSHSFFTCLGYTIAGYYIGSHKVPRGLEKNAKIDTRLILITIVGLLMTLMTHIAVGDAWYSNPGLLLASFGIFAIALRRAEWRPVKCDRSVMLMSKMSFGVYFVHMPILRTLQVILPLNIMPHGMAVIFLWASTAAISFLIVLLFWRPSQLRLLLFDAK